MSEPTTKPPALRDLHRAMGELLTLFAEIPEVADRMATWSIGYSSRVDGRPAITIDPYSVKDRTTAERIAGLLDGTITPHSSRTASGSPRRQRHDISGEHRGVPVAVLVWLPEPSEREELLARLAELDAAEVAAQTGGAE